MSLKMKISAYVFTGFFLLAAGISTAGTETEVPAKYFEEARVLADLEADYFNKRQTSDWNALYAMQHPEFKKQVSIEEYMYFEGRIDRKYRDGGTGHISGGMLPPVEYIKRNPRPKDALGFPRRMFYRWYANGYIKVKEYELAEIRISRNGKYAMVKVNLKGSEQIPPNLIRDQFIFDMERPHTDYYEKIDGQWRVALLTHPATISGVKVIYYIPEKYKEWDNMDFVTIDPTDL